MEKKTQVKQEETKTIENKASTGVKKATSAATEVKKPEVKAVVEEKAVEIKKPVAKKPAAKKTAAKKEVAKKEDMKPEVYIQFYGHEAKVEDVIERAKKQYESEGHKVSGIKELQLYMKPEEGAVYYVINQKYEGKVNLF